MAGIPKLEDCNPGIRPTGFCVLVATAEQAKKTDKGIFLPDSVTDKGQIVEMRGRLVSVAPAAFDFAEWPDGSKPQVGDAVIYAKLAGVQIDGDDGRKYRILNDRDLMAIVDEPAPLPVLEWAKEEAA